MRKKSVKKFEAINVCVLLLGEENSTKKELSGRGYLHTENENDENNVDGTTLTLELKELKVTYVGEKEE